MVYDDRPSNEIIPGFGGTVTKQIQLEEKSESKNRNVCQNPLHIA